MSQTHQREPWFLWCRVDKFLCALPLEHVVETMRPLPVEPIAGAPHFVRGLAIIRGTPIPVVDLARLLGANNGQANRFVTVKLDVREAAIAVSDVLAVRLLPVGSLQELPPLLRNAGAEAISEIGMLDSELLLVLDSARLVPEDL